MKTVIRMLAHFLAKSEIRGKKRGKWKFEFFQIAKKGTCFFIFSAFDNFFQKFNMVLNNFLNILVERVTSFGSKLSQYISPNEGAGDGPLRA